MDLKYQIYGSKSSQDLDIMVFVDKLGSINENKITIEQLKIQFSKIYPSIDCDVHIAQIFDGQVIDVSHGTYDEVNNSLYYTYSNFKQPYENFITKPYDRLQDQFINVKSLRIARFILSFFSREPELRTIIKSALRGDLTERLDVLKLIDFTKYTEFPKKKEKKEDIYKVCAFQFAQFFALIANKEVYTKEDAIIIFSPVADFINRKDVTDKLHVLNNILELFVFICEERLKQNKYTTLYE
jgi:hypothetical protein